jgi:glycosyltransferase involved in cell wall biosynthesis
MAAPLRILLVSRRFWPLVGDSEDAMADLAVGLRRYGAEPSVLTARWSPEWPSLSHFQGVPVHRIPLRLDQPWGRWTYLLSLTRWLRRHRSEFDLVLVARLRREACTVLWALRRWPIPVVLRAEADDCIWQEETSSGIHCRHRCRRAAAIIYRDQAVHGALRQAGYEQSMLFGIPDGVRAPSPQRGSSRLDARLALAAVNQDLQAAADAPIAVFVGRLRPLLGLARLVRAWGRVVRRWPNAKLWLIGDGSYREDLYRLVSDLDLRYCVQMPGTFECTDDLLRAANLLVWPGPASSLPRVCLSAAVAGLPILACSSPEIENEIQRQPSLRPLITLLDRRDVAAWSDMLIENMGTPPDPKTLRRCAQAILRERSMPKMIRGHLELFESLVKTRP